MQRQEGQFSSISRRGDLTDDPGKLTGGKVNPEPWHRSLVNIEGYLRGFAGQFLDRAALYNAAKHGLALRPSEMSMRWDDGSVIRADGRIIQYLEVRERDGLPRWSLVNHWVKPDRPSVARERGVAVAVGPAHVRPLGRAEFVVHAVAPGRVETDAVRRVGRQEGRLGAAKEPGHSVGI
ncbi:MAG TPA: hypothetical protein VMQ65_03385, partial [Candidatus Limnocylindria bacterium]|nr:hypothetical protein [Candidatus Limnocylindria bacterium]